MPAALTRSTWATAVLSARTALTTTGLTLLLGVGAATVVGDPPEAAVPEQVGLSSGLVRMLERHRCSTTGFEPDVMPSKAVVTTATGASELVSFDYGWQVFEGEKPGRLVAVCLGRRPSARG